MEINSDAHPEIGPLPVNIAQYDIIFLGYSIWRGQCPPAVRSFLNNYDLSGKTIMPFCTSGSSSIAGSLSKIQELCQNSIVTAGFRGTASTTDEQIRIWLSDNQFSEKLPMHMKLITQRGDIIIKLNNSNAAKHRADMLPLQLDFSDYNNTEKIAYPAEKIDMSNSAAGMAPQAVELMIYALWANLALFYKNRSFPSSLIPLGSNESGAEYMTAS